MNRTIVHQRAAALLEMLVAAAAGSVVLTGIAYFMSSGTLLFAKNVSTNLSHNSLRSSLDKLVQSVDQSHSAVTLLTTAGTTVTAGSAAVIRFDQYRGGPYVVTHQDGVGLAASDTTLPLVISIDSLASPPLPKLGDVLILADAESTRLKVQSTSLGAIIVDDDGEPVRQNIAVTLQSAAGTAIAWDAGTTKTAKLIRSVAYAVIASGTRNELRYYDNAESITNFATATGYSLMSRDIGTSTGDNTPFSISSIGGRDFLSLILRVHAGQFRNRLSTKEANDFSAVERISVLLAPRGS
jgi:hypothetical protein